MLKSVANGCGRALVAFVRKIPDLLRDVAGLAAVGLISYGAWLVYEPAGYITGGVLLLAGTLVTSFEGRSRAG